MVKRRPPASLHDAIRHDLGQLGYAYAAEFLSKSDALLQKWGTPNSDRGIPVKEALKIGAKLREEDEQSAILHWLELQLDEQESTHPTTIEKFLRRALLDIENAIRLAEQGQDETMAALEAAGALLARLAVLHGLLCNLLKRKGEDSRRQAKKTFDEEHGGSPYIATDRDRSA